MKLQLANKILIGRIKRSPLVLCHSITGLCNLRCKFCPFWRRAGSEEELSLEEIIALIDQAASLGTAVYTVWGVEPLLREELPECLSHAKQQGLINFMITNGMLLEDRIEELAPHLDYLSISIDGTGETYRELRVGGDFEKVLRGLKLASRYRFQTVINCVITSKNIAELERLVNLAEKYSAGILFEPVHEYEELTKEIWQELGIRNLDEYGRAIDRLIELKKQGRKILNSFVYLKMIRSLKPDFKCRIDRFLLHVDPYGNVKMCKGKVSSIRAKPLGEIWHSKEADRLRGEIKNCKGCLFSGYVEGSLFYSANLSLIANYFRQLLS